MSCAQVAMKCVLCLHRQCVVSCIAAMYLLDRGLFSLASAWRLGASFCKVVLLLIIIRCLQWGSLAAAASGSVCGLDMCLSVYVPTCSAGVAFLSRLGSWQVCSGWREPVVGCNAK